ncbi:MAG: sugar phosphate isomerase/epimerase [Anaerolineales bacterium]|nr:sugar phosphate isomerase/epimerase [Anaerolineales bacterium]
MRTGIVIGSLAIKAMRLCATVTDAGSAFSPILFSGDPVDGIRRASLIGYEAVELHLGDPVLIDIDRVKAALAEHNMALSSIGAGRAYLEDGLSFTHDDPTIRSQALVRVKTLVDLFAEFKPAIIIGLIKGKLTQASDQAGRARIDSALEECCAYAAGKNINLCLEQANRYEQDYLHTIREVVEVIERLGASNLRALADTFHMNIEEQSIERVLFEYRDFIGHIHFADKNRRYPGQGMIDFGSIFQCLEAIKYQGVIAVECLPLPDPETAAKRAFDYLRMQMANVQTTRAMSPAMEPDCVDYT